MDKLFRRTSHYRCNYLSMLGLKLNYDGERGILPLQLRYTIRIMTAVCIMSPLLWFGTGWPSFSNDLQTDITVTSKWALWRLKSPASLLFTQPYIQGQIKESINSPVTGEFPAQMASNAENISIWWRHHDIYSAGKMVLILKRAPMLSCPVNNALSTTIHVQWGINILLTCRQRSFTLTTSLMAAQQP